MFFSVGTALPPPPPLNFSSSIPPFWSHPHSPLSLSPHLWDILYFKCTSTPFSPRDPPPSPWGSPPPTHPLSPWGPPPPPHTSGHSKLLQLLLGEEVVDGSDALVLPHEGGHLSSCAIDGIGQVRLDPSLQYHVCHVHIACNNKSHQVHTVLKRDSLLVLVYWACERDLPLKLAWGM